MSARGRAGAWGERLAAWVRGLGGRLRAAGDRGEVVPRVAGGLSALLVAGTVTYVATACGADPTASTASTAGTGQAVNASVSGGTITFDAHEEGGMDTTSVPRNIPADILEIQEKAAEKYDFPWAIIAAISQKETHSGQYVDSGDPNWDTGVLPGTRNPYGAAGIMQFGVLDPVTGQEGGRLGNAGNAWGGMPKEHVSERANDWEPGEMPPNPGGFGIDGNNDDWVDVWDPWDNIMSGAFRLAWVAKNVEENPGGSYARKCRNKERPITDPLECTIFIHNNADWYVFQILDLAEILDREYEVGPALNLTPASYTPAGDSADCEPGQGGVFGASYGIPAGVTDEHRAFLEFIHAQVGKPYVWGATGPSSFDCSGLVMTGLSKIGVTSPRVSQDQWRNIDGYSGNGVTAHRVQTGTLDVSKLQAGDIVFFGGSAPTHVGVYIGNGEMIDAGNPRVGVRRGPLDTGYWRGEYTGAVRLSFGGGGDDGGAIQA
ncbi:C40 family peptidase [Streptomonospora sp. S1-112]|uniref:C40 family peptidase n=1 Tax=Streptomonospora mangrovi TaxID=2883123 RepID=A0A9X3SCH8_9ACTN|nr:C40 family peptidase [Streptomonospora mangrovi]MDA0563683.1 C40 family peptidase [Streptomonospora mangrovi]